MSDIKIEEAKESDSVDNTPKDKVDDNSSKNDLKHSDVHEENPVHSLQEEEEIIKKKYGGMLPKKPPLISKDHERAFFDSADWALGKQGGQKAKGPLEALRPKLQPTPHQQIRLRRSAYAPMDGSEAVDQDNIEDNPSEDQSCKIDASDDNNEDSGSIVEQSSGAMSG
ncbi:hypothetical protein NMG60_11009242 [Bertholletia excelsa]